MENKNQPLISVIVPVYKVGKYLNRCVDSILAQTYTNFECILVDDGSPDNSPVICDEYAKKDNRVRVIHKVNGGVSSARNAGLDAAKGEWVCFVDSDDEINSELFNEINKHIKKDTEVIEFGFSAVSKSGMKNFLPSTLSQEEKVDSFGSWSKAYSRQFLSKNKIKFPEGISLAEDWYFNYLVFSYAKNTEKTDIILYMYYQNETSVMHTLSLKNITDEIKAINLIEQRADLLNAPLLEKRKIISKRHILFSLDKPNVKLFRSCFPEVNRKILIESRVISKVFVILTMFMPQVFMTFLFKIYKSCRGTINESF